MTSNTRRVSTVLDKEPSVASPEIGKKEEEGRRKGTRLAMAKELGAKLLAAVLNLKDYK